MRMLIWKELREHFKWALLAMVVLGLAEYYALYQTQYGMVDYYYYDGMTICKKSFLMVTSFGFPLAGFLLGLLQILPELKRDRWAVLLHRPLSHGSVLRAKVAAGFILYLVATVPAFLLFVWMAATPGYFSAPFTPGMVTPGAADIMTGLVYYFAALALTLPRGGNVFVRAFPLLSAMHVSFEILNQKLFYVAIEAAVLMSVALFTAAWGAIQNRDSLQSRPWLGRIAFVVVVFYGVCGLGDLAKLLANTVFPGSNSEYENYELTDSGIPARIKYVNHIPVSVLDPEGKAFEDVRFRPDRIRNHTAGMNVSSSYIGDSHGWKPQKYQPSYRESGTYMYSNNTYHFPRMEQWFQMNRERILIGYIPDKKMPMEQLDHSGFRPLSEQSESFPAEAIIGSFGEDIFYLAEGQRVRFAYLAKRQINELSLPDKGPVYGLAQSWANEDGKTISILAVALGKMQAIYDKKATLLATLPYRSDINMDRWGRLQVGLNANADRYYLWYEPSLWIDWDTRKTMPSYVDIMDDKGQVLKSYTLPPLPERKREPTWQNRLADKLKTPAFFLGTMGYQKIGEMLGSARLGNALKKQWGADRKKTITMLGWIAGFSLAAGSIALWRARKMHLPPRQIWAWTLLALVGNLAGLLTFLLVADRPVLLECSDCQKKRPAESDTCPHCGCDWPEPKQTGNEIVNGKGQVPLPSI